MWRDDRFASGRDEQCGAAFHLRRFEIAACGHTKHLLIVDDVPEDFVADFRRTASGAARQAVCTSVQF